MPIDWMGDQPAPKNVVILGNCEYNETQEHVSGISTGRFIFIPFPFSTGPISHVTVDRTVKKGDLVTSDEVPAENASQII